MQEIEDTGLNYENILPRMRHNLTIVNAEPVYHVLQPTVHLIPQQPGQEFCQQYSQNPQIQPIEPQLTSQTTTDQHSLLVEVEETTSIASSNAASTTSVASTD